MSLRKIVLVPLLPIALAGCNDDALDAVKNSRMNINEQYTVDQAFSNRDICASVDWDVITDDRNRELVQYKCHISGIESYYGEIFQNRKDALLNPPERPHPAIEPHLEAAKLELESAEKALGKPATISSAASESEALVRLQELSEILSDNTLQRALELRNYYSLPVGQELIELSRRYYDQFLWIRSNGMQMASPERLAAYKQAEAELRQAMAATQTQIQAAMDQEHTRLNGIQQVRNNESAAYAQQRVTKAQAAVERMQSQYETQLAELEAERTQQLTEFENAATIESVAEVFQWVVKGEQIELVWSGLESTYSDGQVRNFGHENRLGSLRDVYSNAAKTYPELRQKAPLM